MVIDVHMSVWDAHPKFKATGMQMCVSRLVMPAVVFGGFAGRMGSLSHWYAFCTMLTAVMRGCLN